MSQQSGPHAMQLCPEGRGPDGQQRVKLSTNKGEQEKVLCLKTQERSVGAGHTAGSVAEMSSCCCSAPTRACSAVDTRSSFAADICCHTSSI
eukprot:scaffold284926_cov25-Prasinocladus_malaysianus.AAC.1